MPLGRARGHIVLRAYRAAPRLNGRELDRGSQLFPSICGGIAQQFRGRYQSGLMRRLHADLLILLAAAIWGFAFYFQKTAMDHIGPFLFISARAGVAALALAPLIVAEARRAVAPYPAKLSRIGIAAGFAFFIAAALQQTGLVTATVTNSGFLTALY